MDTSNIVGLFFTFLFGFIALWQGRKQSNLKKHLKSESMELNRDIGVLLGSVQSCLKELKSSGNAQSLAEAGKTEGLAQSLFEYSIKNIYHNYNYTRKDIDNWVTNKKIDLNYKDIFLKYAEK